MLRLDLVPIHLPGGQDLVDRLSAALERTLAVTPRRRQVWFDPEIAFEPERGQYCSTTLLRLLLDEPRLDRTEPGGPVPPSHLVLGVTGVDLFAPALTYVFGEAQLDGRVAVVSVQRLRAEAYGLAADDALLFDRLAKEALHEIGHVLGLVHCPDPGCVMRSSTYVEDIDGKPSSYCTPCLKAVRRRTGPTASKVPEVDRRRR